MSRQLPPCDHDECPPTHCKRAGKANEQRLVGCDALVRLSDLGTVRLTVGACNRQCQLTYYIVGEIAPGLRGPLKRDLRGSLEDVLSRCLDDLPNDEKLSHTAPTTT